MVGNSGSNYNSVGGVVLKSIIVDIADSGRTTDSGGSGNGCTGSFCNQGLNDGCDLSNKYLNVLN